MEIGKQLLSKYQTFFPEIVDLYPHQEEAISNIINQSNTLSIVPTGGGKSLIFQLGALELSGITLVISPLVALMKEQVDELNDRKINSLALNGNIPFQKQRTILRNLKKENLKLIYLSPERLFNSLFRKALIKEKIEISLIVIDEAHCISQWGGQFRPEYSQIMPFVNFLRSENLNPNILCLTATLGHREREDIINVFQIDSKDIFVNNNIIRSELVLDFIKVEIETEKSEVFFEFLKDKKPKKTLVYLYSRKKCESYAKEFKELGFITSFFHSGMNEENKSDSFYKFKNGEIEIMFATTAFGMGINIPDIDAVVHLQIPNSVEEYYQQVGRGARNKKKCPKCDCLLVWSEINFKKRKEFLQNEKVSKGTIYQGYELMGFKDNKNKTVDKDFFEYKNVKDINLPLLRFCFEKFNLIKPIGELNGTPLTIRLRGKDEKWERFIAKLDDFDSFSFASQTSGIPIDEIIDYIFKLEMNGKVEYLPAMQKSLFFKVFNHDVPEQIAIKIAEEINAQIDLRFIQMEEFEKVCEAQFPLELIAKAIT